MSERQEHTEGVGDPIATALGLREMLLIRFSFDERRRTFILTSELPDRAKGSDRDFVQLEFLSVSKFHLECERPGESRDAYVLAPGGRPFVIQEIECHVRNARGVFRIWFGAGMGGLSFEFKRLRAKRRGSSVERKRSRYVYRDTATGEPFSMYDPFGAPSGKRA